MTEQPFTTADATACAAICQRVIGWSRPLHYAFFKSLLAANPNMKRLLMLGVYHGRDIAFILDILARYHPGRVMEIVGVDKFNAEPCADWPAEKRGMTWEQAFNCPPPSCEAASANTSSPFVTIFKVDDAIFMAQSQPAFDCIYFDTSHDAVTVLRQLSQTKAVIATDGILCGDDYSDEGTWGVKRAVNAALPEHRVFKGWIWHSPASALLYRTDPVILPTGAIMAGVPKT